MRLAAAGVYRSAVPPYCGLAGRASGNPAELCEACLRQFHGDDMKEEALVRGIVGAAVAAALDAGASEQLVQTAVDDALSDRVRVEVG
jgi:hypothetical protein